MARVSLEGVSKRFPGGRFAVRDLTLHVQDRELLVLVGPSGCGKSTTLRIIAGLTPPTSGSVSIGGQSVVGMASRHRGVAMVFQHAPLYPHLTVRQNLAVGSHLRSAGWWKALPAMWMGRIGGDDSVDSQIAEIAEWLEIGDLLDHSSRGLSGGERQRVGVGRALLQQREVLLLDEPFGNLDAGLKRTLQRRLRAWHKRKPFTAIYVTHDQSEAMLMADRLAVMKDGAVEQAGTPLDVYNYPANRFVAQFIGDPPLNLIEGVGELVGGVAQIRLAGSSECIPAPVIRTSAWNGYRVLVGWRPRALAAVPINGSRVDSSRTDAESAGAFSDPQQCALRWSGEVVDREWINGEWFVSVKLEWMTAGGQFVITKVNVGGPPSLGDPVYVHANTLDMIVFDAETGRTLR